VKMLKAVSNIKLNFAGGNKSDTVKKDSVKSDYERTPEKDAVVLNQSVKEKSLKRWIIGAVTVLAAFGIYFLTRGKKAANAAGKASKAAEEIKVKNPPDVPVKGNPEAEASGEVLKPDKILFPKKTKSKSKSKAEKLKSSPSLQDVVDIEPVLTKKPALSNFKDSDNLTASVQDLN